MANDRNKHGLPRYIPSEIRLGIRKKCGFGCVICGLGIYEYEHVDPEFSDAEIHDPQKMTLLCMQCHGKVTKKIWSKDKVKLAMQNPYCMQVGYNNEHFDFGTSLPVIAFSGVQLSNCQIPIQVYGDSLFGIKAPEIKGAPFRLSGQFCNSKGDISLTITDNEWFAMADNWDIEIIGPTITIKESNGNIHLQLTSNPPHGLIVDKLNMFYKNIKFIGDKDSLIITYPDGRTRQFSNCLSSGFPIGLSIGPPSGFVAGMII
jgi:hypothetical protein